MEQVPEEIQSFVSARKENWSSKPKDLDGNPAILAYSIMQGELGESLGWVLVSDQDMSEITSPIKHSLTGSMVIAALVGLALAGIGLLFTRSITRPMSLITQQAQKLSVGDIEEATTSLNTSLAMMKRADEIGDLLRAFLAGNIFEKSLLQHSNSHLEIWPSSLKYVLNRIFSEIPLRR
jgi:methyl-accepting chemotaxis protein